MPTAELQPREWIAVAAAIIAVGSLMIALRSSLIAGRAYALALRQEERRRPSLQASLLKSELRRPSKDGPRIYVFRLMISNTSDSPSTVRDARLSLDYGSPGSPPSSLVTSHSQSIASHASDVASEAIRLPCDLPPRSSRAGVLLFEVPSQLLRNSPVVSCNLELEDSLGHTARVETLFIHERHND